MQVAYYLVTLWLSRKLHLLFCCHLFKEQNAAQQALSLAQEKTGNYTLYMIW
jgi:hypothetical protein